MAYILLLDFFQPGHDCILRIVMTLYSVLRVQRWAKPQCYVPIPIVILNELQAHFHDFIAIHFSISLLAPARFRFSTVGSTDGRPCEFPNLVAME